MQISGDTALKFFDGIEHAMDEAGGGRYRAFNLVGELKKIGLAIIATEVPPEPAAKEPPAEAAEG